MSLTRTFTVVRYGVETDRYGQLWPASDTGHPPAVVVLIHGGYWRHRVRLDVMEPLAADLATRGYVVWNLEYRRVGAPGGGWPGTFQDIAAGIDALVQLPQCGPDADQVAVIGHSAGGQLALWSAARRPAPLGGPARIRPSFAVSLAGIGDLVEGSRQNLSNGAVRDLLGGTPEEFPDRYRQTCPTRMLPSGVPRLVVHGDLDTDVPFEFSARYAAAAAAAGEECEFLPLPGVEHFALIDPTSDAWACVAERLDRWRAELR